MADYRRVFEEGHSYFITIVTHRRVPLLIEHIALLRQSFMQSRLRYAYHIDAIVVLPDHLHMVITPEHASEYPKIVGMIKAYFSRHCPNSDSEILMQSSSRHKKRYRAIWQKRYYEHTIRNEKDWHDTLAYIQQNPVKHGLVNTASEWEYSSFYKSKQTSP